MDGRIRWPLYRSERIAISHGRNATTTVNLDSSFAMSSAIAVGSTIAVSSTGGYADGSHGQFGVTTPSVVVTAQIPHFYLVGKPPPGTPRLATKLYSLPFIVAAPDIVPSGSNVPLKDISFPIENSKFFPLIAPVMF